MGKRKNGERELTFWMYTAFLGMMLIIVLAGFAHLHHQANTLHERCFDVGVSDFVMVGVEGNRDRRRDSPALLFALGAMGLRRVVGVPAGAVRHVDIGFYEAFDLQGTFLFWQVGMREWYVVVNGGERQSCGVYGVDDVLLVMDGLR